MNSRLVRLPSTGRNTKLAARCTRQAFAPRGDCSDKDPVVSSFLSFCLSTVAFRPRFRLFLLPTPWSSILKALSARYSMSSGKSCWARSEDLSGWTLEILGDFWFVLFVIIDVWLLARTDVVRLPIVEEQWFELLDFIFLSRVSFHCGQINYLCTHKNNLFHWPTGLD